MLAEPSIQTATTEDVRMSSSTTSIGVLQEKTRAKTAPQHPHGHAFAQRRRLGDVGNKAQHGQDQADGREGRTPSRAARGAGQPSQKKARCKRLQSWSNARCAGRVETQVSVITSWSFSLYSLPRDVRLPTAGTYR